MTAAWLQRKWDREHEAQFWKKVSEVQTDMQRLRAEVQADVYGLRMEVLDLQSKVRETEMLNKALQARLEMFDSVFETMMGMMGQFAPAGGLPAPYSGTSGFYQGVDQ